MARVASLGVEQEGRWYEIAVIEASTGELAEQYQAGNSVWESQAYFPPGHRSAHGFEEMLRFGRSTLAEMAEEHDAAIDDVVYVLDKHGELVKEM